MPLYSSCLGNAAQCFINLKNWTDAIANAAKVLEKDGVNVKALYRRGLARSRMGLLEEARADLLAAFKLDPDNKPVKVEIAKLKKALKEAKVILLINILLLGRV